MPVGEGDLEVFGRFQNHRCVTGQHREMQDQVPKATRNPGDDGRAKQQNEIKQRVRRG